MVAKITITKNIKAALNYNEKKVQKGSAVCLQAANYLKEAKDMNFYQKLAGFERLNILNERAATKTLHVSLNFDPSEKHSNEKLAAIANQYMEKIGFGEQPYLVYRHNDAGHPHIHIVSTTIKADGSRINTHNIGRNQSEKARKELEQKFGLIKAERQQRIDHPGIRPVIMGKVIYGRSETKKSIVSVVTVVFNQYRFTSLPEYNAVLRQFNVVADRGREKGRIFKNRGLVYRILDSDGNKVGVPIKGSAISCRPILNNLELKFISNEAKKEALKPFVRAKLDAVLSESPGTIQDFMEQLHQKNIYTLLRQNPEGRIYGVTFVDNQNKVVFNGSDLGKGYSAAALQSRLVRPVMMPLKISVNEGSRSPGLPGKEMNQQKKEEKTIEFSVKKEGFLDMLLLARDQTGNMPYSLLKKKRRKKNKKHE